MNAPKEALEACVFCGGEMQPEGGMLNRGVECLTCSHYESPSAEAHNTLARKVAMFGELVDWVRAHEVESLGGWADKHLEERAGSVHKWDAIKAVDELERRALLTLAQSLAPSAEGEG